MGVFVHFALWCFIYQEFQQKEEEEQAENPNRRQKKKKKNMSWHGPEEWRASFERAHKSGRERQVRVRDLRIDIIHGTLAVLASSDRRYAVDADPTSGGSDQPMITPMASKMITAAEVPRTPTAAESVKHTLRELLNNDSDSKRGRSGPSAIGSSKPRATRVFARRGDCLAVCAQLVRDGTFDARPLVLNMASPRRPGGGYMNGAGAQEENVFRRSNYSEVLTPDFYRLQPCEGVYSPGVHVFRGPEDAGYPFIPVETYAFVAVAARANPPVRTVATSGEIVLTQEAEEDTEMRVRTIFEIAARHGHEHLLLSAFGCGAFRNPPRHMARIFQRVLREPRYAGAFRTVVFAIIDDHNAGKVDRTMGNFASFASVFGEG
jgi:uncharacterized protein (TIGR02452 family)